MRICRNGLHDRDQVGVEKDGRCLACKHIRHKRFASTEKGKICNRKKTAKYARTAKGKARIRAAARRRYLLNRQKRLERVAAYRQRNPEKVQEWRRKTAENKRGVNFWINESKESL